MNAPEQELDWLMQQIREEVRDTACFTGRAHLDPRVIQALRDVPRHDFVLPAYRFQAYANQPLPIGHGQTISQPYIVALMTDLISPQPTDVVLEIGTGSGYQAAVLSRLAKQVYSVERIRPLAEEARQRLHRLGYGNVEVRTGNGHFGWPAHAPYDAIIVTAAASEIPPALIEQLKPGGKLVIPLGRPSSSQALYAASKNNDGQIEAKHVLPVIFVPLTR